MNIKKNLHFSLSLFKKREIYTKFFLCCVLSAAIYPLLGYLIYETQQSFFLEFFHNSLNLVPLKTFRELLSSTGIEKIGDLFLIIARISIYLFVGFFFIMVLAYTFLPIFSLIMGLLMPAIFKSLFSLFPALNLSTNTEMSLKQSLKNEIKKNIFLFFLAIVSLFLHFSGLFSLFALPINSFIIIYGFLDYLWSYKNYKFMEGIRPLRRKKILWFFLGFIYAILLGIPFLNVFFFFQGVLFFSLLYLDEHSA